MNNNEREASRWLKQAEYTLDSAKYNFQGNRFAEACFFSQQAAEMALKGFLYRQGRRAIQLHSVQALVQECETYKDEFGDYLKDGRKLDRFYIATRYPDAVVDVLPHETVGEEDAADAIQSCEEIVEFVRRSM